MQQIPNLYDTIYGKRSKRKPIKTGTRTSLLVDSGAKCQKCGDSLKGLRPHIHHKDGNPRNNRAGNLLLVCPNCHTKLHRQMEERKKIRKKKASKKVRRRKATSTFGTRLPRISVPKINLPKI